MAKLIDSYLVSLVFEFVKFLDFLESLFEYLFAIGILVMVKMVAVKLFPVSIEIGVFEREME